MKKLIIIPSVIVIWLILVWISPNSRSYRTFDHLEDSVKTVITASELQAWATNLLAQYPTDASGIDVAKLGTNYPPQLLNISPRLHPNRSIVHLQDDESNDISRVFLDWGGGILGHAGFVVGSTNFIMYSQHEWQKGVYFYPPH